jgi:hypothetical protein
MTDFTNNIVWKWGNASDDGFGYGSGVDYGGTLQCRNNFYQSLLQPANAIIANHNTVGAKIYASGNVSGNLGVNPNDATNVVSPWSVPTITMQDACTAASLVIQKAGPRPLDEADQGFINSVSLGNCPSVQNQAPFANAGPNVSMILPTNSTTLLGSGGDPDGTIITYMWSYVDGPSSYTLGTPTAATTSLNNLTEGTYRFRLRATDNNGSAGSDTVTVIVVSNGSNLPPVADAGSNITLTLPFNSTTLNGTAADADGTITSYTWTRISGPTTFSLGTPNAAITTLTNLVQGTYVFKLTVIDNNGASATDNVTINVIITSSNSITNYDGTEKVSSNFFTSSSGSTDILDWVLVEMKSISGAVRAQRAALVREDGQIVDLDGVSPVSLYGLTSGFYYISIRHRNHLGVRSSTPKLFASSGLGIGQLQSSHDFSNAQSQAYQNPAISTNPAMAQNGSVFMMWAGNANLDDVVRLNTFLTVQGDAVYILGTSLSGNPGAVLSNVYSSADVNLDGSVRLNTFLITGGERPFILSSPLGGDPNAIRKEHK